MNKGHLVSVIMNCYNSDTYLHEAIDSVLKQTYQNWEIIFWDNQSTDSSADIVKAYKDPRIKYFYAQNFTVLGQARNLAVKEASGEWLGFLDCDDIWLPNKLELQMNLLNLSKYTPGLIYGQMDFIIETNGNNTVLGKSAKNLKNNPTLPTGYIFDKLLYNCFIPLPSVLVKKQLFWKVGGINDSLKVAEDYDLFLKISEVSFVEAVQETCCFYRIHDNNLSHKNYKITFEESIELIQNYILNVNTKKALSLWRTRYAINIIKHKDYKQFFNKFFTFSSIYDLISFVSHIFAQKINKNI